MFAICRESDEGTVALKMNPRRLIRQTFTLKAVMFTCVFFILCVPKTGNSSDLNPIETNQKLVPFHDCFKESATQHKLDPNLLVAVAIVESSLDPTAISKANALGLMQIKWPQTAKHLGIVNRTLLFDPCTNIEAGAKYLAEVREPYLSLDQQPRSNMMLAAYRIGPNAVKGFENLPAIVEDYIQKVRLEKDRLDERDLPLIPSPSCILEEFKTIALTTHHPYIRGEKSHDWIKHNQTSCNQTNWEILIANLPNWLGTAQNSPKIIKILNESK